ncbi:MAG: hypothetical protein ACUVRZ_12630 [Desulfobacca sp.]|uniref:hypothetical protein n=1 Tax=Desulfobacca sp. TaxID=2067990 RepID=UPI00404B6D16
MLKRLMVIALSGLVLLGCGSAWAATDIKTLTINASVSARAKLTISPTTINFADADPDVTPSIPADSAVAVNARVRTGASSTATLQVSATNDLSNGTETIPISNVTWTASGSGFTGGTLSKTTAQDVASWTGSGNRSGTLSFFLANSWDYATGSYTTTAQYTLTAP